jgi:hypothetical protein
MLSNSAVKTGLRWYHLNPNFVTLTPPKSRHVVGQGVDPFDAGEIWHMFDQKPRCH